MAKVQLGSLSSGTLRNEDLLGTFADELEYIAPGEHADLIEAARTVDPDSEDASDIANELIDALNEHAPPYAYFGAHEGDGADFGFWLSEYALSEFDGLRVEDLSEVPDDYSGEVLHVNDHGNTSLYVADKGNLSEVWAIV